MMISPTDRLARMLTASDRRFRRETKRLRHLCPEFDRLFESEEE
jgi:hypothetical protein